MEDGFYECTTCLLSRVARCLLQAFPRIGRIIAPGFLEQGARVYVSSRRLTYPTRQQRNSPSWFPAFRCRWMCPRWEAQKPLPKHLRRGKTSRISRRITLGRLGWSLPINFRKRARIRSSTRPRAPFSLSQVLVAQRAMPPGASPPRSSTWPRLTV